MSFDRDDLVGLALSALDSADAERVRRAVEADPALAAELAEIERHLALHDGVPRLRPAPALWCGIRDRLNERPAPRSLLHRFWMPAAAALLVAAALFWQSPERNRLRPYERLHGDVRETPTGTLACTTVSRLRLANGVTVTMDAQTTISGHHPRSRRLVLATGRVFLDVAESGRGFAVEAGDLEVITTGTAFLVDRAQGLVWVESGRVRCTSATHGEATVAAGEFFPRDAAPGLASPRAWFTCPTLTARILDADTIRVVIRNDMPDPLQVAPRTGGEPFFFASFGGDDYPLSPGRFDAPLTLLPNTDKSFLLRLPRSLPDREALFLAYPAGPVRVEAKR
ncbi:MAG: FecR family protein [Planctomycetota bacterium]|jgi:ferric-dicitrate binding protein FerR (iron transport regulator)